MLNLGLPTAAALFLTQTPGIVNLAFIGQKYDTEAVNAVGLCNVIIALIPFTLMYGFNGALDTLFS